MCPCSSKTLLQKQAAGQFAKLWYKPFDCFVVLIPPHPSLPSPLSQVYPFSEPDPAAAMAAESLPFSFGTLSSWELEAWYEDLQEVLSSDENGRAYVSPPGNEEVRILHIKLEVGEGVCADFPISTNSACLSSFP